MKIQGCAAVNHSGGKNDGSRQISGTSVWIGQMGSPPPARRIRPRADRVESINAAGRNYVSHSLFLNPILFVFFVLRIGFRVGFVFEYVEEYTSFSTLRLTHTVHERISRPPYIG